VDGNISMSRGTIYKVYAPGCSRCPATQITRGDPPSPPARQIQQGRRPWHLLGLIGGCVPPVSRNGVGAYPVFLRLRRNVIGYLNFRGPIPFKDGRNGPRFVSAFGILAMAPPGTPSPSFCESRLRFARLLPERPTLRGAMRSLRTVVNRAVCMTRVRMLHSD